LLIIGVKMKIPFKYTVKNFSARRFTTGITVVGIALVVFVFAAVLMMAYGVERTLTATGSSENVKIVRKGSNNEISSIIDGDAQNVIRTLPRIEKAADGMPVISNEPVVVINLDKIDGGFSNVTVRGVSPGFEKLRPQFKMLSGKLFNPSLRELIVGESIAKRFQNAQVGSSIKFAGDFWKIVGIFSTNGSGFDSEIWGDAVQLQDAFSRGNTVSAITLRLDNPNSIAQFKAAFAGERRLQQYEAEIEDQYFAKQSEIMAMFIRILGIFVTVIFSVGATVGAMITMYTAVANRTVEIGTMRALGFSRRSILGAFLTESVLIALVGGGLGLLMASTLQFFSISTLNFSSFAELAFSFALSPSIIIACLVFTLIMGVLGGFLPSARAARLNIVSALRAT
jgi:putative ABC transport system permease protein